MDFGVVGLDCFGSVASDPETKQKLYRSGLLKKQGWSGIDEDGSWRSSKVVKTGDSLSASNAKSMSFLRSNSSSMLSSDFHRQQNQMLSFSCPKSLSQSATLPYFQLAAASSCSMNTGNKSNNNGNVVHNIFTPSQWIELEQQALIYKYICANIPIPSHLLLPIRKAFESVALSGLSAGLLRPNNNSLGWGAMHLGYSNRTDPEPGRCRRTDGKKWRCSRDAVADQKYCERHMNRGRHRSRKPVEGQPLVPSHSSAAVATITDSTAAVAVGTSCGKVDSASNGSLAIAQQLKNLRSSSSVGRMSLNKEHSDKLHEPTSVSILSSASIDLKKPEGNPILNSRQQNPFAEISNNKFEFFSLDSPRTQSHIKPMMCLTNQETSGTPYPLLQLMDSCSRNQLDVAHMSISSEFWSSISTNSEKVATGLPDALSCESDPFQMGFDVFPIEWESSISGPLGEALHGSQTSPRGALQKTPFVSISNSSAGSSPRASSSIANEGFSFCSDLLASTLVNHSSSLPA